MSSVKEIHGNLFASNAKAYVNTVNCVGVMGKGIALEFRRRYPNMFAAYKKVCDAGDLIPGTNHIFEERGNLIINCAVKNHYRHPSKYEWVEGCLKQFANKYQSLGITSVAFPLMGTQNGKLDIAKVKSLMYQYLEPLSDISVEIYSFNPTESDPLFEKLLLMSIKPNFRRELHKAGFSEKHQKILDSAFRNNRVRSLAEFSNKKILTPAMLDKVYEFLLKSTNPNEPNQLSLWDIGN